MIDPRNNVNLTFGVVADPEIVGNNDNILKLRVAVDYAGSEKGGSTTGYFDVTYYLDNDDNSRNAKFVKSQIDAGNIKKGTQLQLIGRLVQERWSSEDKKGQRVTIIAESLTYAGSAPKKDGESSGSSSSASASSSGNIPSEW